MKLCIENFSITAFMIIVQLRNLESTEKPNIEG